MSLVRFVLSAVAHWRTVILFAGWILVVAPSVAANLSGSYIGGGERFVVFLQLAQTDGGQIVGRLRQSSLDAKGMILTLDTSLSGAASGDQFVGRLERSWVEGGDKAVSGQLSNGLLKVSSADGLRIQLRRGRESDYIDSVDALKNSGFRIRQEATAQEQRQHAERALSNIALRIDRLTQQVAEFVVQEPQKAESLSSVAHRYENVSERMEELLVRLRVVTGQSAEEVGRRSSLAASILHTSIEAEHAHIDVVHARKNFEEAANRLSKALTDAKRACGEVVPNWIKAVAFHQACALVPSSVERQSQVSQDVRRAYAELEESWQRERPKQEAMQREAQTFQRQFDRR
jgi:hypothetical protein